MGSPNRENLVLAQLMVDVNVAKAIPPPISAYSATVVQFLKQNKLVFTNNV